MAKLKIGVFLSNFRLPYKEGLRKAKELGFDGVQLWNVGGEMDPENLDKGARRELLREIRSHNLEISALCGELGGFEEAKDLEWKIDKTKKILDLSLDLEAPLVTGHIGTIPEDEKSPVWQNIKRALEEIGAYGESIGACYGAETGPEAPEVLRRFLDGLETKALRVNLDPANLKMKGFDPVSGVYELRDYIAHTHAKDGLRYPDGRVAEVPLGTGLVPFREWVEALISIGYNGFLTVERETGEDPVGDIKKAKEFLEGIL